ncbi:MAG TPA: YARHG domain-containing protein [Chitinispirillaceae bacterium]|nr:YARHG domain-containing protein [Chitinispirillaceae bacterium]
MEEVFLKRQPQTQSSPTPQPTITRIHTDYTIVCPYSNSLRLSEEDLDGKTAWELDLMRNEIFARHGRPFKDQSLRNYFMERSWYWENHNYSDSCLTAIEKENAEFILKYQNKTGKRTL